VIDDESVAASGEPPSERLELLASKRRQTLLEVLSDSAEDVHTLESLATAIAQTEQGTELGARPPRRVCLFLHHVHLPKLDDADIVDYDPQHKVVEYTGDGRIEHLLASTGR